MTNTDINFVDSCICEFVRGARTPPPIRVLDFGCGDGRLVQGLHERGYQSFGCDIAARWQTGDKQFKLIQQTPYLLPYDDQSFDVVFSTGVFEHVLNKEESLREICRVLKDGGVTIHLFPSKYFLPAEPHLFVPILNYLWPWTPRWYLAFWALVGVRNVHQRQMTWRDVADTNHKFCRERIAYWPASRYRECVTQVFGECSFPMAFFAKHSNGRAASIVRRLFGSRLGGTLLGLFRYQLLVARKRPGTDQVPQ